MQEIWKPVPYELYKDLYVVSNLGNVRSNIGNRILKKEKSAGYHRVSLYCKAKLKSEHFLVHRMVAMAFIENNDKSKKMVNHLDGDKLNNAVSNLEWSTHKNNTKHALENGLRKVKTSPIIIIDSKGETFEYESQKEAMKITGIGETTLLRALNTGDKPFGWTIKYKNKADERPPVDISMFENILDFPGYKINQLGEIYSSFTKKLLRKRINQDGYYVVTLVKDKQVTPMLLHRLMAIQYVPNKYNYNVVNHIDHNKKNYSIDNLEWCTSKQNTQKYLEKRKHTVLRSSSKENSGSDESQGV